MGEKGVFLMCFSGIGRKSNSVGRLRKPLCAAQVEF